MALSSQAKHLISLGFRFLDIGKEISNFSISLAPKFIYATNLIYKTDESNTDVSVDFSKLRPIIMLTGLPITPKIINMRKPISEHIRNLK